jgi:hypothetical protein
MSSCYSYCPPKSNSFGHVPLTRDRSKLFHKARAFLAEHADLADIVTHAGPSPDPHSLVSPGQWLAPRFDAAMHARFGARKDGDWWNFRGADLEPALDLLARILAWPDFNPVAVAHDHLDEGDFDLVVTFHFTWRNEAPSMPGDPIGSSISLRLGRSLLVQTNLRYRTVDTLKRVEPDFKAFKLFKLNPKHYRIDGRKMKSTP